MSNPNKGPILTVRKMSGMRPILSEMSDFDRPSVRFSLRNRTDGHRTDGLNRTTIKEPAEQLIQ